MEDLQKAGVLKTLPELEMMEEGKSWLCFLLALLRPDLACTPPSQSCGFSCSSCFYIWGSIWHLGCVLVGLQSRESFLKIVFEMFFIHMMLFPTIKAILTGDGKVSSFLLDFQLISPPYFWGTF